MAVVRGNMVNRLLLRTGSRSLMALLLKCNIFKRLLNTKSTREDLPGPCRKCRAARGHRTEEVGV